MENGTENCLVVTSMDETKAFSMVSPNGVLPIKKVKFERLKQNHVLAGY